jgi:hypothetical protein
MPSEGQEAVMKILVSGPLTGGMIGKAGAVVTGMMSSTGSRIKISQNNEFFPETSDRIVVITGTLASVRNGVAEVVTKMCEVPILFYLIFFCTFNISSYSYHVDFISSTQNKKIASCVYI